jgi:stage II sporulation protein D
VSFAADAGAALEATPETIQLAVLVFIKRSHGSDAAVVSHRVFEEYLKQRGGEETGRGGGAGASLRVRILSEKRVAIVALEDYVQGVLSAEAAVENEAEALKAQAIVTRTYALRNRGRHSSEGYDLCSNTHCQQYVINHSPSDSVRRAVADTAGMALLEASGQPADAYFHAACGGYTANFESLWGAPGPSYLRGVRYDYCATMPNHDWTDQISEVGLVKALASDPSTDPGRRIHNIIVTKTDATGRAALISIEGERRRQVRGWAFKLVVGRSLGWNVLKSSRFSVSRKGSMFVFRGSGFGHGLGLCQNGAHVMARRGATFEQILEKYFPGARLSGNQNHATASGLKDGFLLYAAQDGKLLRFCGSLMRLCASSLQPQGSLSSEHFFVTYARDVRRSEIESAIRNLEAARLDMLTRLGPNGLSDMVVDVVFHKTTQDFIAATGQPWWVAAVTRGKRIELQPPAVLRRRRILVTTLRHEYAHAVIEANGDDRVPRWLAEGLAISFAGEGPMLQRFRSNTRLPLDEIERRLTRPKSPAGMRSLYAAAYYAVRELIRKEGERSVWRRVATPATPRSSKRTSAPISVM